MMLEPLSLAEKIVDLLHKSKEPLRVLLFRGERAQFPPPFSLFAYGRALWMSQNIALTLKMPRADGRTVTSEKPIEKSQ